MDSEFTDSRGVSNVVEVVLLTAIVFLVVGGALAVSVGNYDSAKTGVDIKLVERDMSTLAGMVHDVSFGSNAVRTRSLNLRTADNEGTTSIDENAGRMTVVVSTSSKKTTVYDGPLGRIEYTNQQAHVAYQGSGVWRKGQHGSSIVDSASIALKNSSAKTLSLPIIVINGDGTISSKATVRRTSEPRYSKFKLGPGEKATITVQSRYYKAWARYFSEGLDIPSEKISVNDINRTVTVTFAADQTAYLHVGIYPISVSGN